MTKTVRKLKKKIVKRNAVVRADNKAFAEMTPAEKRVQIAKDVLVYVEQGKLNPRSGRWISAIDPTEDDELVGLSPDERLANEVQLSDYLPKIEVCDACAVGSLLYCTILRANEITVGELRKAMKYTDSDADTLAIRTPDVIEPYLAQFFDRDQLNMIEGAFERRTGVFTARPEGRMFFRGGGDDMWYEHPDVGGASDGRSEKTRIKILMKNIIRNKGTFDPSDRKGMR